MTVYWDDKEVVSYDGLEKADCNFVTFWVNYTPAVTSITQDTGKIIRKWLDSGADVPPDSQDNRNKINRLYRTYLDLFGQDSGAAQAAMQRVTGGRASKDWTDEDMKNLSDDLMLRMQKKGVLDGSDI